MGTMKAYVRLVRALAVITPLGVFLLFLKRDWVTVVSRDIITSAIRCAPALNSTARPAPSSMFTAEEMLYFTTGEGDPLRHERRLVEFVRQRVARPSGGRALLSGVPPVHLDLQGAKHYAEIGPSSSSALCETAAQWRPVSHSLALLYSRVGHQNLI